MFKDFVALLVLLFFWILVYMFEVGYKFCALENKLISP